METGNENIKQSPATVLPEFSPYDQLLRIFNDGRLRFYVIYSITQTKHDNSASPPYMISCNEAESKA